MDTPVIQIGIIDDQTLFRKALFEIIKKTMKNIKVVLEAENGLDFIQKYNETKDTIDLCLLDIHMPVMDGYDTMQYIKKTMSGVKVLALSMYESDYNIIRILKYGANGFLSKNSSPADLKKAILSIYYTGYFDPEKSEHHTLGDDACVASFITDMEITFLRLCCTDMTYAQIAKKMDVNINTLNGYRDVLFKKLHAKTRVGLVSYVLQKGIISID